MKRHGLSLGCIPSGITAPVLIFLLLHAGAPATAHAQGATRAWAMAGAATATATGLDAVEYNPANLAFSRGVTVGLFGVAVDVHNNAFSLARYNEVSGATLDQAAKERILADVPQSGFSLDADVRASALGLQVANFAFSVQGFGAGHGNLDRDFFDLVLFGNELGATVDFQDTWGEAYAVGAATLSYGTPVATLPVGRLAVGANARYLRGFYEMHIEDAHGSLTTTFDAIDGEAMVAAVTAEGGSGYALDLGATLQARGGWSFGLAIDNAMSSLSWSDNPERRVYAVTAVGIAANNDNLDNAVVDSDTTYAVTGYTSTLPRRVRLGASHATDRLLLAADWVQVFETRGNTSTRPQLGAGAEWRLLGWLVPRLGASVGGPSGSSLAGGLGLRAGPLCLDLAVMNRGGFAPSDTRGLGVAVSSHLVF